MIRLLLTMPLIFEEIHHHALFTKMSLGLSEVCYCYSLEHFHDIFTTLSPLHEALTNAGIGEKLMYATLAILFS